MRWRRHERGRWLLGPLTTAPLLLPPYYCSLTTAPLLLLPYYCPLTPAPLLLLPYYCSLTTAPLLFLTCTRATAFLLLLTSCYLLLASCFCFCETTAHLKGVVDCAVVRGCKRRLLLSCLLLSRLLASPSTITPSLVPTSSIPFCETTAYLKGIELSSGKGIEEVPPSLVPKPDPSPDPYPSPHPYSQPGGCP